MNRWMLAISASWLIAAVGPALASEAAIDLQSGLEAAQRGHFDDGIRLLTMAINAKELSPADMEQALKARGLMYQRENKQREALADYSAAVQLQPTDAAAYDMRGTAYAGTGQIDRAIADYNKTLQLAPHDVAAHVNRGFAYIVKRQYKQAIADLDTALELSPKDFAAYRNRATAYRSLGDYRKAAADYDAALRLNPKDPNVGYESGRAKYQLGDFAGAAQDLSRSLSSFPNQPYTVIWLYLAQAKAGKPDPQALAANAAKTNSTAWPAPIIALFEGKGSVPGVQSVAVVGSANARAVKACELPLYIGEYQLLKGDRTAAHQSFETATQVCPPSIFEHDAAQEELRRMKG